MYKCYFAFLSTLLLLNLNNAFAESSVYGLVDLGMAMPSDNIKSQQRFYKSSGNKRFQNAFTYSVGIGYKINDNFRSNLVYSRVDNLKYTALEKKYQQKVKLQSVMINFFYDLPLKQTIRPYLGVGIGYSNINPNNAVTVNAVKKTVLYEISQRTGNLSYSLIAGTVFHINKKLNLDISYKFQDHGENKGLKYYEVYVNGKKQQLPGYLPDQESFRIRTHNIMLGLRYSF